MLLLFLFCFLFVCLFVFLRRCLTSLAEGPRCIRQRQLLLSIPSYCKVYIYLHQRVVDQTFSPRQTMQERTTVSDKVDVLWQLHIKMFGQWLCFQKTILSFSFTGQCMHFLKCMVPFPLNSSISFPPASSNQLWSPVHCPYSRGIGLHAKMQPNIFDLRVFRCIFLWWRTIWVAGSLHGNKSSTHCDSIMSKTVFIRSSFAFTSLDHVTFCLEQYVFKNRPWNCCFVLTNTNLPYYLFLVPFFWWPQNKHLCDRLFFDSDTMAIFINSTAVTLLLV